MALIHVPPADVALADDREAPADEIIDLTDRRRVLLHAVFGLTVGPDDADAVFARDVPED